MNNTKIAMITVYPVSIGVAQTGSQISTSFSFNMFRKYNKSFHDQDHASGCLEVVDGRVISEERSSILTALGKWVMTRLRRRIQMPSCSSESKNLY